MTKAPKPKKLTKSFQTDVEDAFPRIYRGMCEFNFNDGAFSFPDVIEHVLAVTGPAFLDISTWVASKASVRQIEEFLEDTSIHNFRFLVDRGFVANRKELYQQIKLIHGDDAIRTTRNHAKFCLIYNEKWDFVIETSANLNKNARLENFRITEDRSYRLFFSSVFDPFFELPEAPNPSLIGRNHAKRSLDG